MSEIGVNFFCERHDADFVIDIPLSSNCQIADVAFSDFHEVTWRPPTGIPLSDCLGANTTLSVGVVPALDDGECSAGRLWLDTIHVR